MSVALPVVAIVFGSVTPPQGDVKELRVHLGCTNEVSSFYCLLRNFDKKYSPGGTYPINVGDDGSISIGRGANWPLIATIRVEEVLCESTPVENYIRIRGRCWGERLFRRVVTKTYENKKGEYIIKDLIDNYVGLSHVRNSTELIENTDTTYTLLEYENTPVFDIIKYIASSADKAGVIGFDFRVEHDAKFAFFPKNSKTSPVSLLEVIEVSEYRKDIHRVRNKITVYGAAEKCNPSDQDARTESLSPSDGDWSVFGGGSTLSLDSSDKVKGSYSIKTSGGSGTGLIFTFDNGAEMDCNLHPSMVFQSKNPSGYSDLTVELEDNVSQIMRQFLRVKDGEWVLTKLNVGRKNEDEWQPSVFNSQDFDWTKVKYFRFTVSSTVGLDFRVDNWYFNHRRWSSTKENVTSQSNYGLRELVEVDEELHSDNECGLRADALLAHLKDPAEYITVRTTVLDYGTNRLLPADKIHVTLPNENIDADYRIISVEYRVIAAEQTLEITLELGKEPSLLADYLYALRSKSGALARTKIAR